MEEKTETKKKKYNCKCIRCGWEWMSRVEYPKECSRCKAYDWKTNWRVPILPTEHTEQSDAGSIKLTKPEEL